MTWNPAISFGDVLTLIVTIGGLFALYVRLRERLTVVETRMEPMWADFLARTRARRSDDPRPRCAKCDPDGEPRE